MSAAVGVSTAIWAWCTQWGYLPIFLTSLLTFAVCLWMYNNIIWLMTRTHPLKTKLAFDYSYGLALSRLHLGIDDADENKALQIGLWLKNSADAPLKYYVDDFDIVLGDRAIPNPVFTNKGGVIPKGMEQLFFYPPFNKSVLDAIRPRIAGKIKYSIKYGHPETDFIRVSKKTLNVSLRLDDKPGLVYVVDSEDDKEIIE